MPEALDRVGELRALLPAGVPIQVDGGIHLETIGAARHAGASLLVSGSGVFWGDDPGRAYKHLTEAAEAGLQTTTRQGAA